MKLDYLIYTASCKDELAKRLKEGEDKGIPLETKEVIAKHTDIEVMQLAQKLSDEGKLIAVFTTDQVKGNKGIIT